MRETPINREWMKGRNGQSSNAWKGERAGYHAIHIWLGKHPKGKPCEECGTLEYSRLEWANLSGEYHRDRSDYKAMCPRCHRLFDQKNKCRKGHEFTTENTLTNNRGHRLCRICLSAYRKEYATRH